MSPLTRRASLQFGNTVLGDHDVDHRTPGRVKSA